VKRIEFWFDCLSPYAWLAFDALPQALEGISHVVDYRPLLLGAVLTHWGQKGPAEIAPKRDWTYRQVRWLAAQQGLVLDLPAEHPFNPLALQRLAVACTAAGQQGPGRQVVQALFEHVWVGGADANDPDRLAALQARLTPEHDPQGADVKAALRASTDAALSQGVFGVPSFRADGRVFFGRDALPMLAAALRGEPWFEGPQWAQAAAVRPGVQRR
jgi:2-hydroxychromene-2-carboxylate isomerase